MSDEFEDPLKSVFDVLIAGTGLAASITAAAIARSGKKVIHIDALDFYGEDSASFSLNQFVDVAKAHQLEPAAVPAEQTDGTAAASPQPEHVAEPVLDVASIAGITVSDSGETLFEGAPCRVETAPPVLDWEVKFHGVEEIPEALSSISRKITVDLMPCLTLARGAMIDALIRSDVAESYMEFVMLQSACMVQATPVGTKTAASTDKTAAPHGVSDSTEPSATGELSVEDEDIGVEWLLRKLPASKADIFSAGFLSLGEKRKLMKFLQFALDLRAVSSEGAAVDRLNEHALGMGRSLLRPQNKATPTFDFESWQTRPFKAFLAHCELSEPLQQLMIYAVSLLPTEQTETSHCTADEGMRRLTKYLGGLGRYGDTAFVVPRYGHGEYSQAFSRASAVHGGIYMLRAVPTHYIFPAGTGGAEGVTAWRMGDGTVLKARHIVSSPRYVPTSFAASQNRCRVVGASVCVLDKPLDAERLIGRSRARCEVSAGTSTLVAIIVPPHCEGLNNPFPVYLLQQSRFNLMAPGDVTILTVWTQIADAVVAADIPSTVAARKMAVEIPAKLISMITCTSAHTLRPQCLWRQAYSLLMPIAPQRTLSDSWYVVANHPEEALRFTNEHDALEALTTFMTLYPEAGPDAFFAKKDPAEVAASVTAAEVAGALEGEELAAPAPSPPAPAEAGLGESDFSIEDALAMLKHDD